MKAISLKNNVIAAVVVAASSTLGAAAVSASESVAAANISAIYQPVAAEGISSGGQKSNSVSLLDSVVLEWRDPTIVNAELAETTVAAPSSDNVALENIREIFNAYSAD